MRISSRQIPALHRKHHEALDLKGAYIQEGPHFNHMMEKILICTTFG